MNENYVKFETAKFLKEKGFDWECRTKYNSNDCIHDNVRMNAGKFMTNLQFFPQEYSAPTQQMACRWLREVHNVDIWVKPQTGILGVKVYTPYITTYKLRTKGHMYYHEDEPDRYDSKDHFIPVPDDKGLIPAHQHYSKYEDAVEAALQYCLTNLI